jgi:hypothetical protein
MSVAMIGLAEISQHNIHGHLAGDFTGGLSAHSIAYNKDAVPRVISEVIFVILAHAADIGFARNFHCQCHAMSVIQRRSATAISSKTFVDLNICGG